MQLVHNVLFFIFLHDLYQSLRFLKSLFFFCSMVYVDLFRHWQWQQVALLAEDGQGYPEYHAFLKDIFLFHSIQVIYDRKLPKHSKMDDAAKVKGLMISETSLK